MRLEYVSRRAGHCLVLQGESRSSHKISILPVHLPVSYLKASSRNNSHHRFVVPFGPSRRRCRTLSQDDDVDNDDCYAPQAQHEAIMHLRFGMDAALRSQCC